MKNIIPFSPPDITEREVEAVAEALKSGWITTGPKTKLFEKRIAEFCNTPKAVALNSATAAMELTLRLLGIGPGDEVITSAYTYTASASVISHVGAKIVLVDTAKDSYHLDYDKVAELINKNTKAIIPVDIAGVMCNHEYLIQIAESKKNLFIPSSELQKKFGRVVVLADAAHSFGSTFEENMSGSTADFSCFSFHAVKNLTTAEGGAVTWRKSNILDDDSIYKEYMLMSLHGQSKDALEKTKIGAWEYDIVAPYYKCNMTDISASIGLIQFERYSELLDKRKKIISLYNEKFINSNISYLEHFTDRYTSSGHLYLSNTKADEKLRNKMIICLAEKGIASNVHYKPLPMHSAYKSMGFDIKNFPNAYNMYKGEITLPLHTLLSEENIEYIGNSLIDIINR